MKNILFGIAIAVLFTACGNSVDKSDSNNKTGDTTVSNSTAAKTAPSPVAASTAPSVKAIVEGYLKIKNGLASDNGNDAASGGKAMVAALGNTDQSSFTPEQKKKYQDIADDAKENAEHIGDNAGKIAHQREHFEMLSKDMYDLVKSFGGGQPLYQDFCPMYNNGKGATWVSEVKEIKNPYLGNQMPTCGSVKEEIK